MSWAEVKKINSDLSVPLDDLIKKSKSFVASDNMLCLLYSSLGEQFDDITTLGEFSPNVDGSVRIELTCYNNNTDYPKLIDVYLTVDGSRSLLLSYNVPANPSYIEHKISHDINIIKGKTYAVSVTTANSSSWLAVSKCSVNANIIDLTTISYLPYNG